MKNTHKPYVDFETAKMLKKIGYDGDSAYYYMPDPNKSKPLNTIDKFYVQNAKHQVLKDSRTVEDLYKEGYFQLTIQAPLWSEVKEWLWTKKDTFVFVVREWINSAEGKFNYIIYIKKIRPTHLCPQFESPIITEIEGIKKALELICKKKK